MWRKVKKYQISNDDIEQAKGYANAEKVNMVWITTGDENEFWGKYRDTWRPCNKNPFGLSDTKIWRPVRFPKSDSAKALSNYFKKDCPDERYKNYFDKSIDEAIFVSSIQKLIHELNFQKWIDADHKKRKGFRIIEDLGVERTSFGNPGYGPKAHQNRYRTIVCNYAGIDEELKMSLGVYPGEEFDFAVYWRQA